MNNICRYLLVPILLIGVAAEMSARRISEEEAYGKASRFMGAGRMELTRAVPTISRAGTAGSYYVFNREGGGFVIVSGSDRTESILGYSHEGSFDADNIPDNVAGWLREYAVQIDYAETHDMTFVSAASRSDDESDDEYPPTIIKMLRTQWGQDYPYNMYCPIQDGRRTQAGCVATALAQILVYHRHDYQPTGVYTANVNGQEINIMLDTCIVDYDNLRQIYGGYEETEYEMQNVARLMKMCGNLVNTKYGVNGSSALTKNVVNALSYLDYSDEAAYILWSDYASQSEWEEVIYNNLKEYGPVVYRAVNKVSDSGHCFVCDGYKEGFFHINWGFNALWNGFFKLTALNPHKKYDYNIDGYDSNPDLSHGAVINIRPNRTGTSGLTDITSGRDGNIVIHDLSGRQLFAGKPSEAPALRAGIYIIRSGQSVRKVLVR